MATDGGLSRTLIGWEGGFVSKVPFSAVKTAKPKTHRILPRRCAQGPFAGRQRHFHRLKNLTAHFLNAERGELENSPTESQTAFA